MSEWTFSNCSACSSMGCCIEYNVTIIGRDAYVIAGNCHLPVQAFTYYFEQHEPSSTGFKLAAGGPAHDFALAKRSEGTRDGHSPCAFLMDLPEGIMRCGLYELRPHVCRTYPGTRYRGVVQFRRVAKCPASFYDISKVNIGRWGPLLTELRFEYDLYERFVAAWNARVESRGAGTECAVAEYYAQLIDFYHGTERLRPKAKPAWQRLCRVWSDLLDDGKSPLQLGEADRAAGMAAGEDGFWRFVRGVQAALGEI